MAHHARTHPTLNQRLSGKDNPPQISYFSGYHPVKKKGCLFGLHLSGLTLHPQPWPSLISLSRKLQIRHGQRRLQPTKVQPILSLPPEQQEYLKPRHSWGPSNILVESTQAMQLWVETGACCSLTTQAQLYKTTDKSSCNLVLNK